MKTALLPTVVVTLLLLVCGQAFCLAAPLVHTDFAKGDFNSLGWKAQGAWDITTYPVDNNNPGPVARYAANQPAEPAGTLTKKFRELRDPKKLVVSMDVGFGWGAATHSQGIGFMLLDAHGNGYIFHTTRSKATWAVQWGLVANGTPAKARKWAPEEIDATQASIRDGGGMEHLSVARDAQGNWTFTGKNWNKGAGATVSFSDTTTTSFSKIVLLGGENTDELVFNKIIVEVGR
jgi:hypothetical protein